MLDTLKRIPKIMEANINAMLDKAEDPRKMIDQMLIDAKRDLAAVKESTVEVMAAEKNAKEELDKNAQEIEKVTSAAQNALKAGNEEDAKKLIAMKQRLESTRTSLQQNYEVASKNAELMRNGYNKLVNDINELEARKDAAKAKFDLAEGKKKTSDITAKLSKGSSLETLSKYEKMADKELAKEEARDELNKQVTAEDDLMSKYSSPGASANVDAELAKMKAELGL